MGSSSPSLAPAVPSTSPTLSPDLGEVVDHDTLIADKIDSARNAYCDNLLRNKKLVLVLDLDHTLINSTTDSEAVECNSKGNIEGLFRLGSSEIFAKLRPFIHTFLERAHRKFEFYVYTNASRGYALEVVKLLDPQNLYFDSRVITMSDSTKPPRKSLDVLLGTENITVILDDSESVWPEHKKNLIPMHRYHYFKSSCRHFNIKAKSLSETTDERESDSTLASILSVLERVHDMFFDPKLGTDLSSRDVRPMLRKIQGGVLQGCKIAFEPVLEGWRIWNMAVRSGAKCSKEMDSSITHIVSSVDTRLKETDLALQNGKYFVSAAWIEAAYYLWRRPAEEEYVIIISRKRKRECNHLETPSKWRRISYDQEDSVAQ